MYWAHINCISNLSPQPPWPSTVHRERHYRAVAMRAFYPAQAPWLRHGWVHVSYYNSRSMEVSDKGVDLCRRAAWWAIKDLIFKCIDLYRFRMIQIYSHIDSLLHERIVNQSQRDTAMVKLRAVSQRNSAASRYHRWVNIPTVGRLVICKQKGREP